MALTRKEISDRHYHNRKDNGLCPRCGKKLDREGHYCSECVVKQREYRRESRAFYREHGICPYCGKERLYGDEKQCLECKEKNYAKKKRLTAEQKERYAYTFRKQQKSLYDERSAKGICTKCGKFRAEARKKKCRICLDKNAFACRKARFEKVNVKEYRINNHLCYYCGEPSMADKKLCYKCYTKCIEYGKKSTGKNEYWDRDNRLIFVKR